MLLLPINPYLHTNKACMKKDANIKYFIIDDDADDREFFQIALDAAGIPYTLTEAESAVTALEMLPELRELPDYIFLDLNMPLVSGKEFLKILKESSEFSHVPVIIFSTSSYQKDIEETKSLGANHFMSKTPDIDRLSEIIIDIVIKKDMPFVIA
jgi:CheY-like chemotaxis protein